MVCPTAIVILAAGASTRLGQPKQLLFYRGKLLIRHAVDTALALEGAMVIVVLGASAEAIETELTNLPITTAYNADWVTGMGSSLKTGMQVLLADYPDCDSVLFTVCDQPYLTTSHLEKLIQTGNDDPECIVASEYSGQPGVPVLFGKSHFPKLLELDNKAGAKQLFITYDSQISTIPFPKGEIDIDTIEDFAKIQDLVNIVVGVD